MFLSTSPQPDWRKKLHGGIVLGESSSQMGLLKPTSSWYPHAMGTLAMTNSGSSFSVMAHWNIQETGEKTSLQAAPEWKQ